MAYKKCPRCELNWIKDDEDLCDVCKAELKIGGMSLIEDDEDILDTEERICPICKINPIDYGEGDDIPDDDFDDEEDDDEEEDEEDEEDDF